MKDARHMTRAELVAYAEQLKAMIRTLQNEIVKLEGKLK